jgi:hypothetical protein
MKSQSGSIFGYIVAFIWTIFMGVTAVGIGLGAAFPPINLVAKPFVCLTGNMVYEQTTSNPLPGTTYTQTAWYCDRSGDKTEIAIFPMSLYSGVIYGVLLYAVGLGVWLFRRRGTAAQQGTDRSLQGRMSRATGNSNYQRRPSQPAPARGDARARMQQLDELRAANMISEAEYQQKRANILKDL